MFKVGDFVTVSDNPMTAPGFLHMRGNKLIVLEDGPGSYKVIDPSDDTIFYPYSFEITAYEENDDEPKKARFEEFVAPFFVFMMAKKRGDLEPAPAWAEELEVRMYWVGDGRECSALNHEYSTKLLVPESIQTHSRLHWMEVLSNGDS